MKKKQDSQQRSPFIYTTIQHNYFNNLILSGKKENTINLSDKMTFKNCLLENTIVFLIL
jgi:hypothetical protein